jgi:hypothetical protein
VSTRLSLGSRELLRRLRHRPLPGLRTAKLTFAAVLAYLLASWLDTSPDRILAPLTALLVVQATLYQTLSHAGGRVVSVVAGVLLAIGVAHAVGLTWWSLGVVVFASLVLGRLLRLREHLMEVPISAMIVLAVGGAAPSAAGRVVETLLGGAVGLLVNLIVAPPLHVRPAEDAVGRLAARLADFLGELADDLRQGWSRESADLWLDRARALGRHVEQADTDLLRAEESARLHPRGGRARGARPRLRTGLTALEHSYVSSRNLCRTLLDRAYSVPDGDPEAAYPTEVRQALAEVLQAAAHAMRSVGSFTAAAQPPDGTLAAVGAGIADLDERRDRLAALLLVDPSSDQGAWQTHGALLAAVDRLRVEAEAAVRPAEQAWRPPPVAERQRATVRRVVGASGRRRRRRNR